MPSGDGPIGRGHRATLGRPVEPQTPGAEAPDDASLATSPTAPAVVAVVVARDPGAWLEESLSALTGQDYPNLSVLVVDAHSAEDLKGRVGAAAPRAFVRRLDEDPGFGAAANEVLDVVDGAAFYLFCHDDIALAPDALRIMVEEAYRSNAAVVGPKLVDWDDPRRLLQVGQGMDHAGYGVPIVERGELDQSQHDAVRDVFSVPGPCMLVRSDLFVEIGGFDEGISDFLDDVSLSWRAQIAGARVIVAPDARVRHQDQVAQRRGYDARRRLQARHRLRIVLSCYRPLGVLRAVVQTLVLNVAEVLYALVAGRRKRIGDVVMAWGWNLRRLGELHAARRQIKKFRRVPDRAIRSSMSRGSARLNQLLRGQIGRGDDRFTGLARSGRDVAGVLRSGTLRASASVWAVVVVVLLAGSRHLLTRGVPAVGEMVDLGASPLDLLRSFTSGWRTAGLGSEAPAPTALGLFGVLGLASGGALGALRTLLTVGLLPLGALFAYRLPRRTGSRWAQIACLLVYVSIPLPYNALASGRWGALALYAGAPLVVGLLARSSQVAPFGLDRSGAQTSPSTPADSWWMSVLALGLVTALVAAILPVAVVVVVVMALGLSLGGILALNTRGTVRMVATALGAAALAVALHLPWSADFFRPGTTVSALTGPPRAEQASDLAALLRFEVGPLGSAPIGWSFLVAAALPLVIGRGERHTWAVRGWTLALVSFGAAWAAQRGTFSFALPPVEVLLVPAAIGLSLATAMGVSAFQVDLPGYRFGWRQIASGLAAAAVLIGLIPVLGGAFDGRWSMPAGDHARGLAFIDTENDELPFRVLWIGDPAAMPLGGWELEEGLAYGTTDAGAPRPENLWVGSDDGATGLLGEAIDLAQTGQTARLGRLLAPMGVRYVVVPERLAPAPFTSEPLPVPEALSATLSAQLDLEPIDAFEGLTVFRNQAFLPVRSALPGSVEIPAGGGVAAALGLDLSRTPAVLPDDEGHLRWSGPIAEDTTMLLSAAHSDGWEMEVDGKRVDLAKPFGWSTGFTVAAGGDATLGFRTSPVRYATVAVQALAWLLVVRILIRRRLNPVRPEPRSPS